MFRQLRDGGTVRLKLILLILCIAAAGVFIYIRLRPPPAARLAPGYSAGFGRSAARLTDEDPASARTDGNGRPRTGRK